MQKNNNEIRRVPKVYNENVSSYAYNASDINYAHKQLEQAKNIKKSKIFKISVLFILIVVGLIYLFFYSSVFNIKQIKIEGGTKELETFFDSYKNQNIILLNSGNVKNDLQEKYPEIPDIKLYRGLPHTLRIVVDWRTNKLIWQSQGKYYCVDNTGIAYSECLAIENMPIIKDNKDIDVTLNHQVVPENFINFISELEANFGQIDNLKIVSFEVNETIFQVDVLTDKGWKVVFDTTRQAKGQTEALKTFLVDHEAEVTEYIDLRVEGRVYFK